jgi:hypothetical protein
MSVRHDTDSRDAAIVGFIAAWGIGGLLGLVAWNHPSLSLDNNSGEAPWRWHMHRDNAWIIWALAVTLFATFVAAITYSIKRWD